MSITPAKKLALVQRRQQVADLHLQEWTQDAIAVELGISQALVSSDLEKIRKSWRESSIRDFDAARDRELEKLRRIEREAWAGWQRSQQPSQSATVDGEAGSQRAKRTVKHQYGDVRFLDILLRCNEARRQLLGIDAPTKVAATTLDGQPLTLEERRIHIQAIMQEQFGIAGLLPGETMEAHDEGGPPTQAVGGADGRGAQSPEPALGTGHSGSAAACAPS